MSQFTPTGGSGGLPLVTTASGATNPLLDNVVMTTAGFEYSYVLPTGCRQYIIKLRDTARLQLSYVVGQSGTNYITVPRGCFLSEDDLLTTSTITIYFQSDVAAQVAEIISWT